MSDQLKKPAWDPLALAQQLQNIAKQSQLLMQRFVSSQADSTKVGMGDASTLGFDFVDLMTKMIADPMSVAKAQTDLSNDSLAVRQKTAERMFTVRAHDADKPIDKRFRHPVWQENAIFNFVKESYRANSTTSCRSFPKDQDADG